MKIVPTENIFFHASLAALFGTSRISTVSHTGKYLAIVYVFTALVVYWVVLLTLRRPQRLRRWWHAQVANRQRSRFSAGVAIQFLDSLHIMMFFATLLLIIANCITFVEPATTWGAALSSTFEAASIKGFASIAGMSFATQCLSAVASLLGLILTALWVTIFMRAFDAVFKLDR